MTSQIFVQLTESRGLCREHTADFRSSNGRRATLLKQNFLRSYLSERALSGTVPRILIKFGDTHLYRGFNELHERNLGNFLPELADVSGAKSLHIIVLGAEGEHAAYSHYGQPFARAGFVMDQADHYKWLAPAIAGRKDVSAE